MDEETARTFNVDALPTERDENFKRIYTNNVRFAISPWDISMTLTVIEERGQKDTPVVFEQATVNMSPQHFKAFALAVNRHLALYESQNGEIRLPSNPTKGDS